MMYGVHTAFVVTGICYYAVSIAGFWALGVDAGGNIIIAVNNGPVWVRTLARLMVVVHVMAAYQVYAHPAFESIHCWLAARHNDRVKGFKFDYDNGSWAARVLIRAVYVLICLLIACLLPFFGDLMGFVGAVAITPTTFVLPPVLWLMYKRPRRFSVEWFACWAIIIFAGVIGVMGAIGSVYLIVQHARTYRVFHTE